MTVATRIPLISASSPRDIVVFGKAEQIEVAGSTSVLVAASVSMDDSSTLIYKTPSRSLITKVRVDGVEVTLPSINLPAIVTLSYK